MGLLTEFMGKVFISAELQEVTTKDVPMRRKAAGRKVESVENLKNKL